MVEGEFIDRLERGEFGPRLTLTVESLLAGLIQHALKQGAAQHQDSQELLSPFPKSAQRYHGVRWQIDEYQYPLPRFRMGQPGQIFPINNGPAGQTALIATPTDEPVGFTGEQLFNALID